MEGAAMNKPTQDSVAVLLRELIAQDTAAAAECEAMAARLGEKHDTHNELRRDAAQYRLSAYRFGLVATALTREAAPQASGGDGWQRMTDEARAIQLRHLDNHQGDVYHAMQHLAVCFGCRDTRPLTQPIATTDSAIHSQQGGAEGDA